jgi:hypothetical protein
MSLNGLSLIHIVLPPPISQIDPVYFPPTLRILSEMPQAHGLAKLKFISERIQLNPSTSSGQVKPLVGGTMRAMVFANAAPYQG